MSQSLLTGGGAGGVTGTVLVQEASQNDVAKIVTRPNFPISTNPARPEGGRFLEISVCRGLESPYFAVFFIFHRGWNRRIRDHHSERNGVGRRRIDHRRNCRTGKS